MRNKSDKARFDCYKKMRTGLDDKGHIMLIEAHCEACGGMEIDGQCGLCNLHEHKRILYFLERGNTASEAISAVMNQRCDVGNTDKYDPSRYNLIQATEGKQPSKDRKKLSM